MNDVVYTVDDPLGNPVETDGSLTAGQYNCVLLFLCCTFYLRLHFAVYKSDCLMNML